MFINGETTKPGLIMLRIKNSNTIIISLKSHGNVTAQYMHPINGNLFWSSRFVLESADLVR